MYLVLYMLGSLNILVTCFLFFLVTLVAWFSLRLARLALQNVNKDYVIFSYFSNFVTKTDKKLKIKKQTEQNM